MEMNSTNYDFMQNGVDGQVNAMYFDTKSNSLFVAGNFMRAGTIQTANGIAKWSKIPIPTPTPILATTSPKTITPSPQSISSTISMTNSSQTTFSSPITNNSKGNPNDLNSYVVIIVVVVVVVIILVKLNFSSFFSFDD